MSLPLETPAMNRRLLILAAVGALLASSAWAATTIYVAQPWSRPAPKGGTGVGYVTFVNKGGGDQLISASTPIAQKAELHESMVMDGMAMMHAHPEGMALPAGKTTALTQGGYHLMFIGLKKPLKVGDRFPVTLTFRKGGKVETQFEVRTQAPVGAIAAPAGEHQHN